MSDRSDWRNRFFACHIRCTCASEYRPFSVGVSLSARRISYRDSNALVESRKAADLLCHVSKAWRTAVVCSTVTPV
jgi:hypothetical protein